MSDARETTKSLSTVQRMALVKWLAERLAKLREDDLLPLAAAEMPSGSRLPVMFGGRHAGFVNMPQPSQGAAYVSDPAKLLAWAEKHHPAKVEPTVEVAVDDDLIAHLADHYPSALREGRRVRPAWVGDLQAALKDPGWYLTAQGEKLTEVPGITVPEAKPPVPSVNLDKQTAGEIIEAAWRDGLILADDLLSLPAPVTDLPRPAMRSTTAEAVALTAPGQPEPGDDHRFDQHGVSGYEL